MKNLVNREIENFLYVFPPVVAEMANGRNEAERRNSNSQIFLQTHPKNKMSKHSTIHQTTSCLTATQTRTILPTQHRPPTTAKRRENSPGAVTIETATRQHDLRLGIRKQGR